MNPRMYFATQTAVSILIVSQIVTGYEPQEIQGTEREVAAADR